MPPTENLTENSGLQHFVDIAKNDLADRLSVPVETIELIEMQSMVWPDASLGCPVPGMSYAQVLTDGLLIVLLGNGIQYNYHSGGEREPFLCEQQFSKDPGITPISLTPPDATDN